MVPIMLAAALTSWQFGHIDWSMSIPMVAAAASASVIGSGVALALPAQVLEALFPILLIFSRKGC